MLVVLAGVILYFVLASGKNNAEPLRAGPLIPSPIVAQNPYAQKNTTVLYNYPKNAEVEKGSISTGGEAEIITLAPDAVIEIQKTPYTTEIYEKMNSIMKSNGLTQSQVVVGQDRIPAISYKGALPLDTPYQQLVTIFIVNKTIYKVQLMYFAPSPSSEYELTYQELLNSINLQ